MLYEALRMNSQKKPMGVGDWVVNRKANKKARQKQIGQIIHIVSPVELDGVNIKVPCFVVWFSCGKEETVCSTFISRHKPTTAISGRHNHAVLSMGKPAPAESHIDEVLAKRSCTWLRLNRTQDSNFSVLNLQLVMCSSCNADQPENCHWREEFIEMLRKQKQSQSHQHANGISLTTDTEATTTVNTMSQAQSRNDICNQQTINFVPRPNITNRGRSSSVSGNN